MTQLKIPAILFVLMMSFTSALAGTVYVAPALSPYITPALPPAPVYQPPVYSAPVLPPTYIAPAPAPSPEPSDSFEPISSEVNANTEFNQVICTAAACAQACAREAFRCFAYKPLAGCSCGFPGAPDGTCTKDRKDNVTCP